MFQAFNNLQL